MDDQELNEQISQIARLPLQEIGRQLKEMSISCSTAALAVEVPTDAAQILEAISSVAYLRGVSFALNATADMMFEVSDAISKVMQ